MVLTSQTGGFRKPPAAALPLSWLCHSCPSRSIWSSSIKALHRKQVIKLYTAKEHYHVLLQRPNNSSNCSDVLSERRHHYAVSEDYTRFDRWKLKAHRSSGVLFGRMVPPELPRTEISEQAVAGLMCSPNKSEAAPKSAQSNSSFGGDPWIQESRRMLNERRFAQTLYVASKTQHLEIITDEQDKHRASLEFKESAIGVSGDLLDLTNDTPLSFYDPTNSQASGAQQKPSSQQQKYDAGDKSERKRLSSSDISPKKLQPNELQSENHSEQKNAVDQKIAMNVDVEPGTSERTIVPLEQGSDQAHIRYRLNRIYDKVLVVDNVSLAKEVVGKLVNQYRNLVHACDTEVANIDVKQETPVDHGEVICFSICSGAQADFGGGKSCIWVDVLDGGGRSLLAEFAPFFEDPDIKKVWHNYSFDTHVIENYGLKVSGFHADTMHMARLWDSSRRLMGGYSLEALTGARDIMSEVKLAPGEELIGKVSMKAIFGRRKLKKDGSAGKVINIPPVDELQRVDRKPWICYSALDSASTLKLYEGLKRKLSGTAWKPHGVTRGNMFDFYEQYWRPFGELLVKMENEGMLVDRAYLAEIEKVAKREQQVAGDRFRNWASKYCPDAKYMNVGSDTQLRQLFFGGTANSKNPDEFLPIKKKYKIPNVDNVIEDGKKTATKFRNIELEKIALQEIKAEVYTASGWPSMSGIALKTLAGQASAEYDFTDNDDEMVDNEEDDVTCRSNSVYGTAYDAFGGGSKGAEACHAIAALCEVCSIDSLISNFILPLQDSHISGKNGRIHCSLNINTETGRLSARRPNLQNQPALEKDRYKIRQAFIAAPGNSLIVADYGQLELRILAHLANCKSMLDAFQAGGDFHSRTAMNMYSYIRDAVDKKEVLLEWHPQPGEDRPPVPLLKDVYASERRKAKMLNFSIAYGKTAVGLARDWKVSVKEAKETVKLWYSGREEVLEWQEERKLEAQRTQRVHTLLGRARVFPSTRHATQYQKGHIDRAAINTPVQGSAADVAMCAMLQISENVCLKELGWKLLLQVHDEVILEGPTESAEIAKAIVVECMSKPFNGENILKVGLSVDAKCAQNWYSAK